MSKMVQSFDGRRAIEVDPNSLGFGWVHSWHPSGCRWVAMRRATEHELTIAEASPQAKGFHPPDCRECGHPIDFHEAGCTSDAAGIKP